MAQNKTQKTKNSVAAFIKSVEKGRQADCREIVKMMRKATGSIPTMWGESIIGFGDVHLKYASGRELDWFKIGFSPRKKEISLYLTCNIKKFGKYVKKLGPHRAGKGCLYIKSLQDIDINVLQELFKSSAQT
ncbi:MAG: DUF1801 domain-containing protein [Planctomycetes bacterium]|nr:DUF1801 domain-containing protein [Planctomycetota bacterium]